MDNPFGIEKLNEKQQRALELLVEGKSLAQVAGAIGISRATLWRWRALPDFARALAEVRSASLEAAAHTLAEASRAAVDTFVELLGSDSDSVRLGAAREVLARCGLDDATSVIKREESGYDYSRLSNEELWTLHEIMEKLRS